MGAFLTSFCWVYRFPMMGDVKYENQELWNFGKSSKHQNTPSFVRKGSRTTVDLYTKNSDNKTFTSRSVVVKTIWHGDGVLACTLMGGRGRGAYEHTKSLGFPRIVVLKAADDNTLFYRPLATIYFSKRDLSSFRVVTRGDKPTTVQDMTLMHE